MARGTETSAKQFCYPPEVVAQREKRGHSGITLIGSGNLAQALGPALVAAGYRIDSVITRDLAASRKRATALANKLGAKLKTFAEPTSDSDIFWICHTDDALNSTARLLAPNKPVGDTGWKGKIILHSSGALTSAVLIPLKRKGAHEASLHPMMTFVPGTKPDLSKVPFAVEGDAKAVAAARQIVRRLGSEVFTIRKKNKILYHALGSFASPMIVATLVTAERVGRAAGLSSTQTKKLMAPILRQTIKNYLAHDAEAAFSGPIKRGDLETVRRHLRELKRVPGASDVYRALVKSGARDLPVGRKKELLGLLQKP